MLRLCSHWLWFWFIMEVLWLVTSRAIRKIRWWCHLATAITASMCVRWGECVRGRLSTNPRHQPPLRQSETAPEVNFSLKYLPMEELLFQRELNIDSLSARWNWSECLLTLSGWKSPLSGHKGPLSILLFYYYFFFCCCTNTRLYPKNVLRKHTQRRVLAAASSR